MVGALALLEQVKQREERLWYARKTVENGWSRTILVHWIESGLYERQGKAQTNFQRTLPKPQSDLARVTLKDPYKFEFLTLAEDGEEKSVEEGLLAHIQKFLIELGAGFALVGQQVRLEVGGADFYIDLLFYHPKLRSYVVIDIKTTAFKPEYAGEINSYLTYAREHWTRPGENPPVGLILCVEHGACLAKYALEGLPTKVLAAQYRTALPSEATLAAELERTRKLLEGRGAATPGKRQRRP
jgi:predicted nuclease of restriction endonuclease-like (RecB) superfamily